MEPVRFYCDRITEPLTELSGAEAHHISSVHRLSTGDIVALFYGCGVLACAVIKTAGKRKVVLEIEDLQTFKRAGHRQVIIATSIAKGEHFDDLITKCTELGVDRIVPVLFDRTVKKATNPKAVEVLKTDHTEGQMLLGGLEADLPYLIEMPGVQADRIAFVGPEGGVKTVRLTLTTLRVETASLAFASILTAKRDASC